MLSTLLLLSAAHAFNPTPAARRQGPAHQDSQRQRSLEAASPLEPVLVIGSINIDLFAKLKCDQVSFGGTEIDVSSIKGMTLPAASFVESVSNQLEEAGLMGEDATSLVQRMSGPFVQKTGGKGANAAAAAGQTASCEFIGNLGRASAESNSALLADMAHFGEVETGRCALLDGSTGTAFILQFSDNDNAIVLLGGANQCWPAAEALLEGDEGASLRQALSASSVVMLQREIPEYVNACAARLASALGKPVFMDVGGMDTPLDASLLPYLTTVAPNESELTFITGVETRGDDGNPKLDLVREAVAALKAAARAAGNDAVEVLVTFGASGSLHFGGEWQPRGETDADGFLAHEVRMGTFRPGTADGRPKDTTGAGDCFRGSYAAARYVEGNDVRSALRWAAAASSLACEVEGAMVSMPTRAQIEERARGELRVPPL